jgi:hypothetical protein
MPKTAALNTLLQTCRATIATTGNANNVAIPLGLNDITTEGTYVWDDNTVLNWTPLAPVDFTAWRTTGGGQPDGTATTRATEE